VASSKIRWELAADVGGSRASRKLSTVLRISTDRPAMCTCVALSWRLPVEVFFLDFTLYRTYQLWLVFDVECACNFGFQSMIPLPLFY
jgi:hypothetical protein